MESMVYVSKVGSEAECKAALLLVKSLRFFGGDLSRHPVWVFTVDYHADLLSEDDELDCQIVPLGIPEHVRQYPFGEKVFACAAAEKMLSNSFQTLVWIDPACLIIQPPILYALDHEMEAAFRPVHIRNIGVRVSDPLDGFWNRVYAVTGYQDLHKPVETFVDQQSVYPYFNSHAFAIHLDKRLLTRWLALFEQFIGDREFQSGVCSDSLHRIFLHQAILSALVAATVSPERIRILPSEYNYPYHLHTSTPLERRAKDLNGLVSIAYEDCALRPSRMQDIEVFEPLKTWLETNWDSPDRNGG